MSRSRRKLLLVIGVIPLAIVGAFALDLYYTQEKMIFPGTKLSPDFQFDFDVPFQEMMIPVDGAEISGLHFQQPDPRGLIFFLHGNGGSLDSWTTNVGYYQEINYDLFIFDYRGYGKSTGQIQSEAQLHEDVRTVWEEIAPLYPDKPIVLYGRSLGTALATKLATTVNPDLLILVSPFSSMIAMARRQYPYLPDWLLRYQFRTDEHIADVQTPIVFVHGDQDNFIPLEHSITLKDRTSATARMLVIEGAGHGDIHEFRKYLDGLAMALPN